MKPLQPGADAPTIPGTELPEGPAALLFYKVTCPTCQMAGPPAEELAKRFPQRFLAVAQDPPERIEEFGRRFASIPSRSEPPPYEASNAYGVRVVPTLFVIEDGRVMSAVESWNRDAWNDVAARLAAAEGVDPQPLSVEGDGRPPFRPG